MDETEIERLAIEELEREAKLAAARAKTIGLPGWQKCPLPHTNKRFLQNTLLNMLTANNKPSRRSADHRWHSNHRDEDYSNLKSSVNRKTRKHSSSCSPENRKKHKSKDSSETKHHKKGEKLKQMNKSTKDHSSSLKKS